MDVTGATGTADMGFGMGATWADYDHDGRLELPRRGVELTLASGEPDVRQEGWGDYPLCPTKSGRRQLRKA